MRQPKGVEILDAITAKALDNPQYKQELLADPVKVLTREGLTVPAGVNVVVHENTANTVHLALPRQTPASLDFNDVDITTIACHTGGT